MVIVLLNNNGGAIFDMLPQASGDDYFERLFLVPQDVRFEQAARAFSVPYRAVSTVEEFAAVYEELLGTPGVSLIEVTVPLRGVKRALREVSEVAPWRVWRSRCRRPRRRGMRGMSPGAGALGQGMDAGAGVDGCVRADASSGARAREASASGGADPPSSCCTGSRRRPVRGTRWRMRCAHAGMRCMCRICTRRRGRFPWTLRAGVLPRSCAMSPAHRVSRAWSWAIPWEGASRSRRWRARRRRASACRFRRWLWRARGWGLRTRRLARRSGARRCVGGRPARERRRGVHGPVGDPAVVRVAARAFRRRARAGSLRSRGARRRGTCLVSDGGGAALPSGRGRLPSRRSHAPPSAA